MYVAAFFIIVSSGGSRPSDRGGGGGSHPDSEISGGDSNTQFCLKIRGGG